MWDRSTSDSYEQSSYVLLGIRFLRFRLIVLSSMYELVFIEARHLRYHISSGPGVI